MAKDKSTRELAAEIDAIMKGQPKKKDESLKDLAAKCRKYRTENGLTQKQLADEVKISKNSVSSLETETYCSNKNQVKFMIFFSRAEEQAKKSLAAFGAEVRAFRKQVLLLSQARFGEIFNVTGSRISQIERAEYCSPKLQERIQSYMKDKLQTGSSQSEVGEDTTCLPSSLAVAEKTPAEDPKVVYVQRTGKKLLWKSHTKTNCSYADRRKRSDEKVLHRPSNQGLKQMREEVELKLEELAYITKLSVDFLEAIEAGQRTVGVNECIMLAGVFGLTPEKLAISLGIRYRVRFEPGKDMLLGIKQRLVEVKEKKVIVKIRDLSVACNEEVGGVQATAKAEVPAVVSSVNRALAKDTFQFPTLFTEEGETEMEPLVVEHGKSSLWLPKSVIECSMDEDNVDYMTEAARVALSSYSLLFDENFSHRLRFSAIHSVKAELMALASLIEQYEKVAENTESTLAAATGHLFMSQVHMYTALVNFAVAQRGAKFQLSALETTHRNLGAVVSSFDNACAMGEKATGGNKILEGVKNQLSVIFSFVSEMLNAIKNKSLETLDTAVASLIRQFPNAWA